MSKFTGFVWTRRGLGSKKTKKKKKKKERKKERKEERKIKKRKTVEKNSDYEDWRLELV